MSVSAVAESVFTTILDQLSEEIGALLGAPIKFAEQQLQILNKEQILAINRGRSVISTMVVSGDNNGEAYIITDLKDSVILGGTLIMLPKEQIEENCKTRNFSGEAADAFGEVANIIAGVYTTVFLDLHPQNYHFKRTAVADFVPAQVDPKSDNVFPQADYVYSRCSIKLGETELHNLEVIVPAQLIGEVATPAEAEDEPASPDNSSQQEEPTPTPTDDEKEPEEVTLSTPEVQKKPAADLVSKETVDRVLHAALEQCAEEIGAMLGLEIGIESLSARYTSKKEFFAKPGKKTIATQMLVSGSKEGTAYFLTDLKDAIYFAGTMIMLPADEMEKHIRTGEFGEDEADAFGEVTNIISGGLVQNFDEIYPRKFHLKKGGQDLFTPSKVQIEDPTPFPPGEYYIVSGTLSCDARELSEVSFLCSVDLLHMVPRPVESDWGAPAATADDAQKQTTAKQGANPLKPGDSSVSKPAGTAASSNDTKPAAEKPQVIVVVCDDEPLCTHFVDILSKSERQTLVFSSSDSFNDLRKKTVLGTFFIMTKVSEQSFATMIKIRAEIPQDSPLIVAGPQWTRSDVLKAVRYGASDILVTPASSEEICEKTKTNMKITCH